MVHSGKKKKSRSHSNVAFRGCLLHSSPSPQGGLFSLCSEILQGLITVSVLNFLNCFIFLTLSPSLGWELLNKRTFSHSSLDLHSPTHRPSIVSEFPGGASGKEPTCQCRRRRFDTWSGKIPWKRKWQPIPVFLLGESLGQRSLVGYSPWGHKELDTTEHLSHTVNR